MNKEKIFDLVNQIDKVYKMAHNLEEPKPESIKITLFKVKDGKDETSNPNPMPHWSKNQEATFAFENGYCAILIDDGEMRQRRYCPEIEVLFPDSEGWQNSVDCEELLIEQAINHPRWTVESHGIKMRAYRSKNGGISVDAFYEDEDKWRNQWQLVPKDDVLLKALGFDESNIMPQILSGKE